MRLRVLPLPEGAGDERPPYLLVVDQVANLNDVSGVHDVAATLTGCHGAVVSEVPVELPEVDAFYSWSGELLRYRVREGA